MTNCYRTSYVLQMNICEKKFKNKKTLSTNWVRSSCNWARTSNTKKATLQQKTIYMY